MTTLTDEEYRRLTPDLTLMPKDVDFMFSSGQVSMSGKMDGFARRLTYKGTDAGVGRFSHNNSGWGRCSTISNTDAAGRLKLHDQKMIGLRLKSSTQPGEFLGIPVGSLIREANSDTMWRVLNNQSSFVLSDCANPSRILNGVNPNLGIRRCLTRHTRFNVARSANSGDWEKLDIQFPTTPAYQSMALDMYRAYVTGGSKALAEYLFKIGYKYDAGGEKEILAAVAYETGSWDEFDNLCA